MHVPGSTKCYGGGILMDLEPKYRDNGKENGSYRGYRGYMIWVVVKIMVPFWVVL